MRRRETRARQKIVNRASLHYSNDFYLPRYYNVIGCSGFLLKSLRGVKIITSGLKRETEFEFSFGTPV